MWKVGDSCLAPYSGDNELYLAVIKEINNEGNYPTACVRYLDYSSDENEVVSLVKLKETNDDDVRVIKSSFDDVCASTHLTRVDPPSSKFVSPLRYLSEDERLRAKFADLHEEPLLDAKKRVITSQNEASLKPSESSNKQKRKKDPVVIGGNEIQKRDNSKQPRLCPAKDTAQKKSPPISKNLNRTTDDSSNLMLGFTSEELEKPFFPGKSDVGSKLPLVLSKDDCQEVIQVPATINRYLRDYQKDGVKFLYQHFRAERGCILADDMGLGKTIQVIAFMSAVLKKKGNQEDCQRSLPQFLRKNSGVAVASTDIFLIVCPNSVLFNWLEELDTWTYCAVGKYHGKDRDEVIRKALRGRLDVVVTTFETYRTKLESLLEVPWTAIIVDEVHKIKESNSQITAALKEIPTRRRFGLTGTALQNKMAELWCVLDWANPGCLGLWKDFKRKFEMVITKGQKYDASKRELAAGRKAALEFSKLRQTWLLRRTKSLISEQLPTKDEKVVFCQLTDLQISVSKALLASDDMKLVLMQNDPCDCGSQKKKGKCHYKRTSEGLSVKAVTFSLMSALIKAANHTALLIPSPGMSPLQQKTAEKFSKIAFAKHPQFTRLSKEARFSTLSDPHYCGKMMILERLLEMFKKERGKVLLFSYYTKLLDILEMYLRTTDYIYFRLDGKTPASERQRLVRDFNQDPDVFIFLISTKAGGMGLNLTGANVVIIFDPNWNPMYDLQAQDRAYRIGQHRDVRVYRLISTGCIEENMYLRQVYKQQLASVAMTTENAKRYFTAVAGEGQQKGELFGLQNMFSLRTEGSCLTRDLILREVKTEKGITTAKYIPPKLREENEEESPSCGNQVSELECDAERSSESLDSTDEDDYDSYSDEGDTHGLASQLCESSSDCISPSEEDEEDSHPGRHNRRNKMNFKKRKKGGDDFDRKINKTQETDHSDGGKVAAADKGKSLVRPGGRVVTRVKRSWVTNENGGSNVGCEVGSEKTKEMDQRMEDSDSSTSSVGRTESRVTPSSRVPYSRSKIVTSEKPKRDKEMTTACVMNRYDADADHDSCQEDGDEEGEVFRECGVAYVHSNLKVIGASKVEDHVSKTALHDVYENEQFSQEPAFCKVPTLDKDSGAESDDVEIKVKKKSNRKDREEREEVTLLKRKKRKQKERKPDDVATHRIMGETTLFVGQTPVGIRREQFKDMAKKLGFASVEKLAETITQSSDETCREILIKFYQTVYPSLEVRDMYPAKDIEENRGRKNSDEKKTVKVKTLKDKQESSGKSETILRKVENKSCSSTHRSHPVEGFKCSSDSDCGGNDFSAELLERGGLSEFDQLDKMKKSFVSSVTGRSRIGGEKISLMPIHSLKFDSLDSSKLSNSSDLSDLPGMVQKGKMCNSTSNTVSSSNVSSLTVNNFSDFSPSKKRSILSSQERNEMSAQPNTDLKINLDATTSDSDLSFLDDIFLFPSKGGTRKPPPSNERWKKRVRTLDGTIENL